MLIVLFHMMMHVAAMYAVREVQCSPRVVHLSGMSAPWIEVGVILWTQLAFEFMERFTQWEA